MTISTSIERVSEIQDEILEFTWMHLPDTAEKFFVQGRVADDDSGKVTMVEGNLKFVVMNNRLVESEDIVTDEEFDANVNYVRPRLEELHDVLLELQGKSPVRFRWVVDVASGNVQSDWTYFEQLSQQEQEDGWWKYWNADFAWRDQLQAELDAM